MPIKNIVITCLAAAIVFAPACKKSETPPAPPTAVPLCLITGTSDQGGSQVNTYDSKHRLTGMVAISGTDSSFTTIEYDGNTATMFRNKSMEVSTFYLNGMGYADSVHILYEGQYDIHMAVTLNAQGNATAYKVNGTVGSSGSAVISELINIEYVDGNAVKSSVTANGKTEVTTSTYYTDQLNKSATSESAANFLKANKNLLKKVTNPDGSINEYTYEYDADGKVIKQTISDNASSQVTTFFTWLCK